MTTHFADDATLAYIAKLESEYEKLSVDYEKLQHDAAEWHAMWQAAERELATHKVRMAAVVKAEQERDAARVYAETIVERAAKLCELRRSEILLMAGEMSAGELRCVQAVMSATAAKIRALAAEGVERAESDYIGVEQSDPRNV